MSKNKYMKQLLLLTGILVLLASCRHAGSPRPATAQADKSSAGPVQRHTDKSDPAKFLRRETSIVFDKAGRATTTYHNAYQILTRAGVEGWAMLSISWSPYYEHRPRLTATVTTPDGKKHRLDPSTIAATPVHQNHPELLSDRMLLKAPLPAVCIGAVVEYTIVTSVKQPLADMGSLHQFNLALDIHTEKSKLILEAPESLPLRYLVRGTTLAPVEDVVTAGQRRIVFTHGPSQLTDDLEPYLPDNVPRSPHILITTVTSWTAVARAYLAKIEQQLERSPLVALAREAMAKGAPSRQEKITRLLALTHQKVRYTGLEFGEAAIVPSPPATVLRRGYGDCKDKAAFLIALLRAVGIEAHLVLLRAGFDTDVQPDMPGLNFFNHAIVYVPGRKPLWIDPTAPFARAGNLPLADRNRFALIIAPSTTALVKTPATSLEENRYREEREVSLALSGKATVVETSHYYGILEQQIRESTANDSRQEMEKVLKKYIKNYYASEKLDRFSVTPSTNLQEPFKYILTVKDTGWALTYDDHVEVAFNPATLFNWFPDYLSSAPSAEEKERQHDLVLEKPYQAELVYKIKIPEGYQLRPLPKKVTHTFGPASLAITYQHHAESNMVEVMYRFSTGKERYTPADVKTCREALNRYNQKDRVAVLFLDHRGFWQLSKGKVRDGLKTFQHLVERHPSQAIYHSQYAKGLIQAGFGEKALLEAHKATDLDPRSAKAFTTLGMVLEHDRFGRNRALGFDYQGALSAYRRAVALDPKNELARGSLAILLEFNKLSERYTSLPALKEAIVQYRYLRDKLKNTRLDTNLLLDLFYSHDYQAVKKLAPELKKSLHHDAIWLSAIIASEGYDAAEEWLKRSNKDIKEQINCLTSCYQLMIALRDYPRSADILSMIAQLAGTNQVATPIIEQFRKIKLYNSLNLKPNTAINFVKRFIIAVMLTDFSEKNIDHFVDRATLELLKANEPGHESNEAQQRALLTSLKSTGLSRRNILDIMLSLSRFKVEGNDVSNYRVVININIIGQQYRTVAFVKKSKGQFKLLAFDKPFGPLGLEALDVLKRGGVQHARTFLNWIFEEMPAPKSNFSGHPFMHIWSQLRNSKDPKDVALAAASLLRGMKSEASVLQILERATPQKRGANVDYHIKVALAEGLLAHRRFSDLLRVADELIGEYGLTETTLKYKGRALTGLGRPKELQAMAQRRLRRFPNDTAAQRWLAVGYGIAGQHHQTDRLLRAMIDRGQAPAWVYNLISWNMLFMPKFDSKAVHDAEAANKMTGYKVPAYLHTLATVYAEVDNLKEAQSTWQKLLETRGGHQIDAGEWYVFGRIAEQAGLTDVAKHAYQQSLIVKQDLGEMDYWTPMLLAKQRLKALSK